MPSLPGMISDVFFGDAERPLPDWRASAAPPEGDEDDTPTPEEAKAVAAILGFDPAGDPAGDQDGADAPAALSLDGEEGRPSLADEALARGAAAALVVGDEIRRKVRALAKKGYPPPSS